jgi:hypothetical protein
MDLMRIVFTIGVLVTIEQGIGQGTVRLSHVVPDEWIPWVIGWCNLLGFIGSTIMTALSGYSSFAGQQKGLSVPPAAKTVAFITVLLAGLLLAGARADAQSDRFREPAAKGRASVIPSSPQLTGNIVQDVQNAVKGTATGPAVSSLPPDQLWQKIITASVTDLAYAKALADNAASPGSRLRSTCYAAWITTAEQAQGSGLKDAGGNALTKPEPALFTTFEQVAEVADNLQPTSPFMVACAPAANAFKMSVAQLVSLALGGTASLAALGIAIP